MFGTVPSSSRLIGLGIPAEPLFRSTFKQTGIDENRVAKGYYAATGVRPHNLDRVEAYGIHLPPEMFEKRILMKCGGRVST